MKSVLSILTLFIVVNLYSQQNVTLYFRNGDSIKVISHITAGNSKIRYRKNKDGKKITVDYKKIKKATQHYKTHNAFYTFKIKQGHTVPVLLQLVKF